jgi:zinc D-Ala-D-Ala carboxypeptidase
MFPDIQEVDWKWPHFTRNEMKCKGNGECRMDPAFLDMLETLRLDSNMPLHVTSGYRSPEHNAKVSKTGLTGPHTTGRAVDIAISGKDAWALLIDVFEFGFYGIGINQKGPVESRIIHLDILEAPDYPRPRVWTY